MSSSCFFGLGARERTAFEFLKKKQAVGGRRPAAHGFPNPVRMLQMCQWSRALFIYLAMLLGWVRGCFCFFFCVCARG